MYTVCLITEKKNETNSKKADGAILANEIGDDASDHIIRGGREPVAQVQEVVEGEHHPGADNRVDDADKDELPGSLVYELDVFHC